MAESMLAPVLKECEAIKYVIGASALYTHNSFDDVMKQSRFVITKVPDTFGVVNNMIKTILVHNPNLSDQKREPLIRHSQKKLRILTDLLKKRLKYVADVLAHLEVLRKQCKYCCIQQEMEGDDDNKIPLIGKHEIYDTKCRPSKEAIDAGKKLRSARAVCSVIIDQKLLDTLVEQECRYVLVCTDTELDARQIQGFYKRNFLIKSIWARLKSKQLSLESFYFKE